MSISSKGMPLFVRSYFVILHWTQPGFVYSVAFVIHLSFRQWEACSQSSAGCPCAAVNSTPFHVVDISSAIFDTAQSSSESGIEKISSSWICAEANE